MTGGILAFCIPAGSLVCGLCAWRVHMRRTGRFSPRGMGRAVTVLSEKITESGFNPDIVITVEKNGWAIGEMLVRKLGLLSLTFLGTKGNGAPGNSGSKGPDHIPRDLAVDRLRVLLVTDAVDTGDTLKRAFQYVSSKGPRAVRTASVFQVETAEFVPDYNIHRIKSADEVPS